MNERIRYPEVRVVGEGINDVMSTRSALDTARQKGLDLVVITENAKPPVAKILDFNKYLYEQNKKSSQVKAKAKKSETKEFRIGARIDPGGIEMRVKRARGFLEDGNRVKITVRLRGRERAKPELGTQKLEAFVKGLEDVARTEDEIKKVGNAFTVTLIKK